MPYAVMIHLEPETGKAETSAAGYCAHAAFLSLIRGLEPAVAQRLHDDEGRKPFTTWLTRTRAGDTQPARHALRLTILEDQLFAPIVGGILAKEGLNLHIGDTQYRVTELATHPAAHHLAGFGTFGEIAAGAATLSRITVRFVSPTSFRSQGRDVLWPDPRLVWQSWLRSWNEHCDESLRFDERLVIEQHIPAVRVRGHEVRTRRIRVPEGVMPGFAGHAEYDLSDVPPEVRRNMAALARYAFFCGTGRKTTMGLGQTRPLNLT